MVQTKTILYHNGLKRLVIMVISKYLNTNKLFLQESLMEDCFIYHTLRILKSEELYSRYVLTIFFSLDKLPGEVIKPALHIPLFRNCRG